METTMTLRLIILACALLAVSGCIVAPFGGERGYYNDGGYHGGDYGRRAWRE
jgi:hypothetical protein